MRCRSVGRFQRGTFACVEVELTRCLLEPKILCIFVGNDEVDACEGEGLGDADSTREGRIEGELVNASEVPPQRRGFYGFSDAIMEVKLVGKV